MLFAKDEPAGEDGGGDEQRREAHGDPRIAAAVGAAFRAEAWRGCVTHGGESRRVSPAPLPRRASPDKVELGGDAGGLELFAGQIVREARREFADAQKIRIVRSNAADDGVHVVNGRNRVTVEVEGFVVVCDCEDVHFVG